MRRRNFIRVFESREYGATESSNPLFPTPSRWHRLTPIIGALFGASLAIGACGLALYGPYFKLNQVSVVGVATLDSAAIEAVVTKQLTRKLAGIVPTDQRWFFRTRQTEEILLASFPLKAVTLMKNQHTLEVSVVEDISMLALRSGDAVFIVNPEGKIIREANPDEKTAILAKAETGVLPELTAGQQAVIQADMPIIRDKQPADHATDEQVFEKQILDAIIAFSDGLRALGYAPKEFVREDAQAPWFSITSDKPFLVLFDARQDIDRQVTVLKTVTNEYFATQDQIPQYIDVRFGTRVYTR